MGIDTYFTSPASRRRLHEGALDAYTDLFAERFWARDIPWKAHGVILGSSVTSAIGWRTIDWGSPISMNASSGGIKDFALGIGA
jgi:hypothetical protein